MTAPPASREQLMARVDALAGLSYAELAAQLGVAVPDNLKRDKGWGGQLIERALGADGGSRPLPDFAHLGIELKTLPINRAGEPLESTYVCTVPLGSLTGLRWEDSVVQAKLACVLWLPVLAERGIAVHERLLGSGFLWQPDAAQTHTLRGDFEELLEQIALGGIDAVTARMGQALQIRPKAADSRVLTEAIGAQGTLIRTLPRGFYLRSRFTAAILRQQFGGGF